jgi:hypothetical protein
MYCLQAVIATEHVLSDLVATIGDLRIVSLGNHLSLLPMTNALFDAVSSPGHPSSTGSAGRPRVRSRAGCLLNERSGGLR